MSSKSILLLGFGYTAKYAAKIFAANDYKIYGTSRSHSDISSEHPSKVNIMDFTSEALAGIIESIGHIVVSTPPTEQFGDPSLPLLLSCLQKYNCNFRSITYFSTTGVYGDHRGAWVDENTIPKPASNRNHIRLQAELNWHDLSKQYKIPLRIFRLAGIYGPGRNALIQVKSGNARSIFKDGHVFSRIHVEDIARILFKTIEERPDMQGIFNLADDYPCDTVEVNRYAANLLDMPEPEIIDYNNAQLSEMAHEFYAACKRVKNDRIKDSLSVDLLFPNYQAGLDNIYKTNKL